MRGSSTFVETPPTVANNETAGVGQIEVGRTLGARRDDLRDVQQKEKPKHTKTKCAISLLLILLVGLAISNTVLLERQRNTDINIETSLLDNKDRMQSSMEQLEGRIKSSMRQLEGRIQYSMKLLEGGIQYSMNKLQSSMKQLAVVTFVRILSINGTNSRQGRVEVNHNGIWGTICDDDWDLNDAKVVCRMAGFQNAIAANKSAAFGRGMGQIWLDNVQCSGEEHNIGFCGHSGWGGHYCSHSKDASVICG